MTTTFAHSDFDMCITSFAIFPSIIGRQKLPGLIGSKDNQDRLIDEQTKSKHGVSTLHSPTNIRHLKN